MTNLSATKRHVTKSGEFSRMLIEKLEARAKCTHCYCMEEKGYCCYCGIKLSKYQELKRGPK